LSVKLGPYCFPSGSAWDTWSRFQANGPLEPLADRDGVGDSAVLVRLLSVMARTAHYSGAPQMLHQFLLQSAAGLDEEAAIDRLAGPLTAPIVWIGALEPTGNLLR